MTASAPKRRVRGGQQVAPTDDGPLIGSRAALIVGFAAVVILGVTALMASSPLALWVLVRDGSLLLIWLASAGGFGWAALKLVAHVAPLPWLPPHVDDDSDVLVMLVSAVALGLGLESLLLLGFGLAGCIGMGWGWGLVAAGVLALAVIASSQPRRVMREINFSKPLRAWLRQQAVWEWLWLLTAPILVIALVAAMAPPGILWKPGDPHPYDVVEYHLQVPREWYELGRVVPLKHNVFSYMPFNVEMHYLLAMALRGGPWAAMYLAQLMHLAMVVLTVLAVYAFARRRACQFISITATVGLASVPWLAQLGAVAYDEGGFLLFGTLAVAWAIEAVHTGTVGAPLLLAGAFAGLACGAKLTAVPEVLGGLAIAIALALLLRHRSRPLTAITRAASASGVLVIVALLAFSPWLVRNGVWAGNPIFPEAMRYFAHAHFTPTQVERFELAHQATPGERTLRGRLAALSDQVLLSWQYGYLLLPAGALAALLRSRADRAARLLAVLLLVICGVWLFATHLQGRFFVMALPVAALLVSRFHNQRVGSVVAAVIVAGAVWNAVRLYRELSGFLYGPVPIAGVLGADLEGVEDQVLSAVPDRSPIVLVGDGKAFWYTIPMSRLRYRTVFDVAANSGDPVRDWIGAEPLPADAMLVIDAGELSRFEKTYWRIAPLSPATAARLRRDASGNPLPLLIPASQYLGNHPPAR